MGAVEQFMREGYAFPCACCKKLWRNKAKGLDQCEAAQLGERCGGPVAGMSFPLYEGPLSLHAMATRCMRCGEPASEAVDSWDTPLRFVGICKRCAPMLDDRLVPVDSVVRGRVVTQALSWPNGPKVKDRER